MFYFPFLITLHNGAYISIFPYLKQYKINALFLKGKLINEKIP